MSTPALTLPFLLDRPEIPLAPLLLGPHGSDASEHPEVSIIRAAGIKLFLPVSYMKAPRGTET